MFPPVATFEPVTALKEAGLIGVAILLFIANYKQMYGLEKTNKELVEAAKESNGAIIKAQLELSKQLGKLSESLVENHQALTASISDVLQNQKILATNQTNQTHTTNEVVRELIGIIRDEARS